MGRYVIAVGGTGSKVLEAIVYAACADAFSTPGEGPLPALDLLSVDVDASCGNTTRLKRAAEAYEEARAALAASPYDHPCFHTRLSISRWSMNLSRRAASVRQMAARHALDGLLPASMRAQVLAMWGVPVPYGQGVPYAPGKPRLRPYELTEAGVTS